MTRFISIIHVDTDKIANHWRYSKEKSNEAIFDVKIRVRCVVDGPFHDFPGGASDAVAGSIHHNPHAGPNQGYECDRTECPGKHPDSRIGQRHKGSPQWKRGKLSLFPCRLQWCDVRDCHTRRGRWLSCCKERA